VDVQVLGFALAAGLIAALNPCGFAMLPAYLTLVVLGDSEPPSRPAAVTRALAATGTMALGFLVVFGTFGLVVAPLAASVQRYLPFATVLIGLGLVVLGALMLTGREPTLLLPKSGRGAPTRRLRSMFGYGLAYATASLSCTIGPFLAVTSTTFRRGSVVDGVLAYLAYGIGMALVVGVLATAVALAGSTVLTGARRLLPHVNRLGGALLVLVGLYVGYYGVYELRLFFASGTAADPVVETAAAVQEYLAAWVNEFGPLPWIAALLAVVLVAVLVNRQKVKRGER
jgi:cytochrome c-type biogenesis protein